MRKKLDLAAEIFLDTPKQFQKICHESGMSDLEIVVACENLREKIACIEAYICHQYVGKFHKGGIK